MLITILLNEAIKWLFECNNITESDFSSYEDPNTIAMSIQSEMRKMNINIDISGIKLKNGYGMHLCEILLALINRTLKAKKVTLGQPSNTYTYMYGLGIL